MKHSLPREGYNTGRRGTPAADCMALIESIKATVARFESEVHGCRGYVGPGVAALRESLESLDVGAGEAFEARMEMFGSYLNENL